MRGVDLLDQENIWHYFFGDFAFVGMACQNSSSNCLVPLQCYLFLLREIKLSSGIMLCKGKRLLEKLCRELNLGSIEKDNHTRNCVA